MKDRATALEEQRRAIEVFDYAAPAEMFVTHGGFKRSPSMAYHRFRTAAEAIRFAIEEVPAPLLMRATLECLEERFDHQGIRKLYDGAAYPLPRH